MDLSQSLDRTVWPRVMRENEGWLASVVYARVKDRHAVEEVLQETALAASKTGRVADDEEGVFRWLYRVAIRQSILYRRKKMRTEQRVRDFATRSPERAVNVSRETGPLQLLVASENEDLVKVGLNALDSRECQILMLKYFDGWSCRQIAERLGASESAIKSRLLRARNNLRNQIDQFDQ